MSSLIWRRNTIRTPCRTREWQCEALSPSEVHGSTTKSGGMWENPKEVRGRERRVQEKANPRPGQVRAEHRGQEEEMIIVDPDALIAPRLLDDGVTEALIDLHVRRPLRLVIPHVRLKQMQQGPEGAVTHPIIIVSDVARA